MDICSRNVKGFILDCDGTLVESMELWDNIYIEFMEKFGLEADEELLIELESMFLDDGVDYLIDRFKLDISYAQGRKLAEDLVFDMYLNRVCFKEGALEFLDKYKDVKKCILSTTDKKYLDAFFKSVNMTDRFEFIACASEFGATKHFIKPYELAAAKMGLTKDEVVVFEDAYYAIKTLVENDYYVVGIEDKMAKNVDYIKKNSNQYVKKLTEFVL